MLGDGLCQKATLIECLVSGSNVWERLIAGVSGNGGLAQRDEAQQGIILNNLPTSISYGPGGEIDFDPSSLFVTGTNWQSVLTALKGVRLDPSSFQGARGREEVDCFGIIFDSQHDQDHDKKYTREYCMKATICASAPSASPSSTMALAAPGEVP